MLTILGAAVVILVLGLWYEKKGASITPGSFTFIIVALVALILGALLIAVAG